LPAAPNHISASFDYVSAIFVDHMIDGEMALWGGAGPEAYNWDEKAESQFRRAIQSNPNSARAHLNLGAYLGINSTLPSQIEEGFHECCKAAELRPKWDLPRIEAANILLRVGNHRDALVLLERATTELTQMSPRLTYTIGFAKMMNNDLGGALSMFEKATELKPDYALAFDNGAYCSFRLGDEIKGRRYAKSARQFGISTTFDTYNVGKTKQEPEVFPFRILCETVPCQKKDCKSRAESEEYRDKWKKGLKSRESRKAHL
jgi:tetratricopeptide (TPR) repeat protein